MTTSPSSSSTISPSVRATGRASSSMLFFDILTPLLCALSYLRSAYGDNVSRGAHYVHPSEAFRIISLDSQPMQRARSRFRPDLCTPLPDALESRFPPFPRLPHPLSSFP